MNENDKFAPLKLFLVSLSVSFFVLMVFFAYVVTKNPPTFVKDKNNTIVDNIYLPSAEENFSLFFAISKTSKEKPYMCGIINFDTLSGQVPIITFPPEVMGIVNNKPITLNEIFANNKSEAKKALENYAKISCDKYLYLTNKTLDQIVFLSDRINVKMPFTVALGDNFAVNKGNQIIDGTVATKLMEKSATLKNTNMITGLSSDILSGIFNNILPILPTSKGERIFNTIVNNSETDINFADFEKRLKAFDFMYKLNKEPSFGYILQGKYNDNKNTFSFSENSIKELKSLFPPKENITKTAFSIK